MKTVANASLRGVPIVLVFGGDSASFPCKNAKNLQTRVFSHVCAAVWKQRLGV